MTNPYSGRRNPDAQSYPAGTFDAKVADGYDEMNPDDPDGPGPLIAQSAPAQAAPAKYGFADLDEAWVQQIANEESRGSGDYRAVNPDGRAFGRYQFRGPALQDVGLKDKSGSWTGKWGVRSDEDFLSNRDFVQDRALEEYTRLLTRYNRDVGNDRYVGQQFQLPDGRLFTVTQSGLDAAGHRSGAGTVQKYLDFQHEHGGAGDLATLDKATYESLKPVQNRLVAFERTPYRRSR